MNFSMSNGAGPKIPSPSRGATRTGLEDAPLRQRRDFLRSALRWFPVVLFTPVASGCVNDKSASSNEQPSHLHDTVDVGIVTKPVKTHVHGINMGCIVHPKPYPDPEGVVGQAFTAQGWYPDGASSVHCILNDDVPIDGVDTNQVWVFDDEGGYLGWYSSFSGIILGDTARFATLTAHFSNDGGEEIYSEQITVQIQANA